MNVAHLCCEMGQGACARFLCRRQFPKFLFVYARMPRLVSVPLFLSPVFDLVWLLGCERCAGGVLFFL